MIKKILVPIAFSPYSKEILEYAGSIAGPVGAEMIIVNVINERDLEAVERIASYGYKVDGEHYVHIIQEERRKELEQLTDNLTLADEKVSFQFLVGDPATELLKMVVDEEIDMVVMGVKAKDIKHMFTGSVAERLFRKCPCTIVSYRDTGTAERLRRRIERHRHKA
ncbi:MULTISPECIES: universal stress protein [Desulfosediminicola]|uniref:universal stress protein n=1 Tax=Desulfosediminicola TaxID=2886823 RepID=UPI0010AD86C8|nr:universal stress protein [Desulfosediminicola ganghwensis]